MKCFFKLYAKMVFIYFFQYYNVLISHTILLVGQDSIFVSIRSNYIAKLKTALMI